MLEVIIRYLQQILTNSLPNSVDVNGLAELIERVENGQAKKFPAIYCTGDEYKLFQNDKPYVYFRKRGKETDTESFEESVSGCDEMITRTFPLLLVAYLPKSIYNTDNAFIDSKLANNIANTLTNADLSPLISSLGVYEMYTEVLSTDTDRYSVWRAEYTRVEMAARFDHVMLSVEFDVIMEAPESCLRNYECGDEVVVPNPCPPLVPATANLFFEDHLIDTISIPCGGTGQFTIDCLTPVDAVTVSSSSWSHQHTGTFIPDGEINGKPKYVKIGDDDRFISYNGTQWVLQKVGGGAHQHLADPGNEDFPWEANWDDADLDVFQATIGTYCEAGGIAFYEVRNSAGTLISSGSIPANQLDVIVLPNVDIDVNGVVAGQPISQMPISVNLSDGVNPITPDSVTLTGNTLDIELLPWVRPSDWLPMPNVVITDDTFVGLYAVFPSGNNFAAFRFTTSAGDYQVDWGDGTIDLVNSNVAAEHTYDYTTYDPTNSTLTTRGYKQAMITVTAVSGLLRTCTFNLRRTTIPAQNQAYATGFLDCILSMPNANSGTSIVFGGNLIRHSYVECFNILTIGACTSMSNMFSNCLSLQSVPLFNTALVTDMLQMFNECRSIKKIPLFNTAAVTRFQQMFMSCDSLEIVPLFNVSSGTNFNQMFSSCRALKEVPFFAFNPALNKDMSNMFSGCSSLQSVPLFDTTNATNMGGMFSNCARLQRIPLLNTANATSMNGMFNACTSLQYIPALSTASVNTSFSEWGNFGGNMSLDRCDVVFNESILLRNCQLSQAELVHIFNNLAVVVVSKNINISGNWGASALTLAERAIATGKNWTITG